MIEGQVVEPRHDLLLSATDWQSRALILAQLQEMGYEVMATPGLNYAVSAILKGLNDPPLLLIDVHHDPSATPEKVRDLLLLLPQRPVILVVDILNRERWEPLRDAVACYLQRPVSVGEIIDAVQALLPDSGAFKEGNVASSHD